LRNPVWSTGEPRTERLLDSNAVEVESKQAMYRTVRNQLAELLAALDDPVAIMATTAALLHDANPSASWTGFYRVVDERLLRVGPYQGPVGCLEIPFDRGVCGTAAARRKTQVVPNVHEFPGHIACDPGSRSEIVVPIENDAGVLVAVLDIDSHEPAAFDAEDRRELEEIARMISTRL
jgi:L-methionine (R)-S-oxide reductase